MIWVSFESSRPDLERKRVKSWKSRLFKKKFLDSAKLFEEMKTNLDRRLKICLISQREFCDLDQVIASQSRIKVF